MSNEVEVAAAVAVPEALVRLRLVPVLFTPGECEHLGCTDMDHEAGYGMSDAVSAWSDCNRAYGKTYRVDEPLSAAYRLPGDTVEIWVNESDVAWFSRKFGESS